MTFFSFLKRNKQNAYAYVKFRGLAMKCRILKEHADTSTIEFLNGTFPGHFFVVHNSDILHLSSLRTFRGAALEKLLSNQEVA